MQPTPGALQAILNQVVGLIGIPGQGPGISPKSWYQLYNLLIPMVRERHAAGRSKPPAEAAHGATTFAARNRQPEYATCH